jgi:hypothetical protein
MSGDFVDMSTSVWNDYAYVRTLFKLTKAGIDIYNVTAKTRRYAYLGYQTGSPYGIVAGTAIGAFSDVMDYVSSSKESEKIKSQIGEIRDGISNLESDLKYNSNVMYGGLGIGLELDVIEGAVLWNHGGRITELEKILGEIERRIGELEKKTCECSSEFKSSYDSFESVNFNSFDFNPWRP